MSKKLIAEEKRKTLTMNKSDKLLDEFIAQRKRCLDIMLTSKELDFRCNAMREIQRIDTMITNVLKLNVAP